MRSAFTLSLLLVGTLAANKITQNFEHVLNGTLPLTQGILDDIFSRYVYEYRQGGGDSKFLSAQGGYDFTQRRAIFEGKIRKIISHNADQSQTWKKGINSYTDMTHDEFRSYYHLVGDNQECSATYRPAAAQSVESILRDMPSHWDWRQFNAVTPVKDQGNCGSCWTFSTIGTIEAHFMMKYGQFRNLSEQQLVDCAGDFDNDGCDGGLPSHAFEYLKYAGGLTTEAQYPYMAVD